jgi:hypothetical protein
MVTMGSPSGPTVVNKPSEPVTWPVKVDLGFPVVTNVEPPRVVVQLV